MNVHNRFDVLIDLHDSEDICIDTCVNDISQIQQDTPNSVSHNVSHNYDNDSSSVSFLNASASCTTGDGPVDDEASHDCMFPDLDRFRQENHKNFIFAHMNINWFHSKFQEVHDILFNNYVDFFAITETKLNPGIKGDFKVENYSMYRQDRPQGGAGGGLICYIYSTIPHRPRKDLAYTQDGIESMVFEIMMKGEKWFFISVYRPGSVSILHLRNALEYMCQRCGSEGRATFLMGDINVDFLKDKFLIQHELDIYNMTNLIKGPTCFKNPDNPSSVDVILCTCPRRISSTLNVNIGVSDHHNITLAASKLYVKRQPKKQIIYRSYKNLDDDEYLYDLQTAPFHVSHIFDDVDDQLWFHNKLLTDVIDTHAPMKKRVLRPRQLPFMNSELRKNINIKGMLKRRADRIPTKVNKELYRIQNNKVTSLKRRGLAEYLNDRCNKTTVGDKSSFWKTVKPLLSDTASANDNITLQENGKVINDKSEICNVFNDYFVNVADDLGEPSSVSLNDPLDHICEVYDSHPSIRTIRENSPVTDRHFEFKCVTSEDIFKKLSGLKINKAFGYDNQPPRMIKLGAPVLCMTLLPIVNTSLTSSIFPSDLKHAEISPIFKKEDNMNKKNFRPVSILVCQSKLFESFISDQLMDFFVIKLSQYLAAYRKGYSTQHVLMKALEDWKLALDNKEHVGCVLMDLSKAFDALPHCLLLAKLKAYGVSESACLLILSYLSMRKQRVKIGKHRSDWQLIKRGVPQGSITGPLLFNIFLNDLFYFLHGQCNLYNYADDNTLSYSNKDIDVVKTRLENVSNIAITWFKDNHMQANAAKFQVAVFSRDRNVNSLCLNVQGHELLSQDCVKLLGINIDRNLTFHEHISEICKKAAQQINSISRFSKMINMDCRLNVFNAFLLSNFLYCPLIWHFCSKTDSRKMEKLQERALRFVHNDMDHDYAFLLEKSEKTTLYILRLKHMVIEIYKVIHGISPPFLCSLFKIKSNTYDMRFVNVLDIEPYDTVKYGLNTIRYKGATLWNELDEHFRNVKDLSSFKSMIRKWPGPKCTCGFCLICLFKKR